MILWELSHFHNNREDSVKQNRRYVSEKSCIFLFLRILHRMPPVEYAPICSLRQTDRHTLIRSCDGSEN